MEMNNNILECTSCGNIMQENEKTCKYCGSTNKNFNSRKSSSTINEKVNETFSKIENNFPGANKKNSNELNGCLLATLLVLFWPAGIVYLIVKLTNKK